MECMSGIQLGLAGNVSLCCDMGLVGNYPKYVPKFSKYVTLPHFGCLRRLLATHVAAMTLRVILCQSFRKCISNLVFCVIGEYLDKPLSHMFAKMMIANINVLGPWTQLGKP
jgi:hypothetical protein